MEEKKNEEIKSSSKSKNKLILVSSAAGVIIILIIGYFLLFNKSSAPVVGKSIAVLPFKNMSPDKSDEYFSDGITEDLTAELSQIGDLKVIARNAVMKYKNSDASIKDIGNQLGVSSLLEGSIQKEGNEVRIVAQLVDVNTGEYIWAGTYDKELTQIFAIQSDVSKQIARALKAKLTPAEKSRIEKKPTNNITAYQYYLKGREYYYRYTMNDNENAIKLFKEALKLDPKYALAYTGLGDCYGQRVLRFGFNEEWNDSSIAASNKAISLDPNLAEGYKALALAQSNKGWIKQALETNKKAVKLNPNYWPAVGNVGIMYFYLGELANAIMWDKKACRLDPQSGMGYAVTGSDYAVLTDYSNAEKYLKIALNIQPDLTQVYWNYIIMHFDQGNFKQVMNDCEKILALTPNDEYALLYLGIIQIKLGNYDKAVKAFQSIPANDQFSTYGNIYLAYIFKKMGHKDDFNKLIRKSKERLHDRISGGSELYLDALYMFVGEVVEGNNIEAFKWLNKAVKFGFRDYNELLNDPVTQGVRNDTKFISIIKNIKDKIKEQQDILASMKN